MDNSNRDNSSGTFEGDIFLRKTFIQIVDRRQCDQIRQFFCLDDFLKPAVKTILAQIAHIIRLFLTNCHFSNERILGNFL